MKIYKYRLSRSRVLNDCFLFGLASATIILSGAVRSNPHEDNEMLQEKKSATVSFQAKYDFLISLPADYEQKDSHPLMLFLHGVGERGGEGDLDLVATHGPPKLIKQGRKFPCIVVSPQCPDGKWWDAAELSALLDHVEANYKVDKKRIYITGLSMGGYGTWALAMHQPSRFAAVVPVCGGGNHRAISFLKKLTAPVWAFHGEKDEVIPLSETEEMAAAFEKAGAEVKVTIYPGIAHNAWDEAYATEELFEWMFAQQK